MNTSFKRCVCIYILIVLIYINIKNNIKKINIFVNINCQIAVPIYLLLK